MAGLSVLGVVVVDSVAGLADLGFGLRARLVEGWLGLDGMVVDWWLGLGFEVEARRAWVCG